MRKEEIEKLELSLAYYTKGYHKKDLEILYGNMTFALLLYINEKLMASKFLEYNNISHQGEILFEIDKLSKIAFDNECQEVIVDLDEFFDTNLVINIGVR